MPISLGADQNEKLPKCFPMYEKTLQFTRLVCLIHQTDFIDYLQLEIFVPKEN